MKKLKEIIKAVSKIWEMTPSVLGGTIQSKRYKGLVFNVLKKGNRMKRVKSFFKGYMRAIEINAALMYGYRSK